MIQAPEMQKAAAGRYLAMLTQFVSTVRGAVVSAKNSQQAPQQAKVWQEKALPVLENRLSATEEAMTHFLIGNQQPLIEQAMKSISLARDLDGYPLTFAGEEFAGKLEDHQRLAVFAAWQLCDAVGVV
ncbi:MAG TPA: hypothetical protein VHT24_07245 [Pseudacidobacterium sp.]|jgi:hypothetical protein|nr:hypothetical protein [Pseudacidobacterium sp.]